MTQRQLKQVLIERLQEFVGQHREAADGERERAALQARRQVDGDPLRAIIRADLIDSRADVIETRVIPLIKELFRR
jgi:hypothetical protein